ncbi:hypothetical protein H8959_000304 [Pygathrix nigripes]
MLLPLKIFQWNRCKGPSGNISEEDIVIIGDGSSTHVIASEDLPVEQDVKFQGKAAIVEKLSSLPFQKIQHSITAQDHQPTPDSCIISMVVGQLKADEDPIMGFHQMFLLKNISDAWVCTNDMFRLALHNFG